MFLSHSLLGCTRVGTGLRPRGLQVSTPGWGEGEGGRACCKCALDTVSEVHQRGDKAKGYVGGL